MTIDSIRIRDGARVDEQAARPARTIPWRAVLFYSGALLALACIVGGIALIYLPAGLIAAGLALVAALTFDPGAARKVTWPR